MQATMTQNPPRAKRQKTSFKGIGRAVKYLTHYKSQAILPYIFLVIATLSQLAVPRMICAMICMPRSRICRSRITIRIKRVS